MATRKLKIYLCGTCHIPTGSAGTHQWHGAWCQLPSSWLLRVGDLWAQRGSEVMERGKLSSFSARGSPKVNTSSKLFSAQTISSSADYFYYILGQALLFGEVKRNMSAVWSKLLKAGHCKKMLTSQGLGVMEKGLLRPASSVTWRGVHENSAGPCKCAALLPGQLGSSKKANV